MKYFLVLFVSLLISVPVDGVHLRQHPSPKSVVNNGRRTDRQEDENVKLSMRERSRATSRQNSLKPYLDSIIQMQ